MSQEDHQRRRRSLSPVRRITIENSTLEATKLIWLWHRPVLSHDTMLRKTMSFNRIKRHRRRYDTSGISHEDLAKYLVHWPQRDFLHVGDKPTTLISFWPFNQRFAQYSCFLSSKRAFILLMICSFRWYSEFCHRRLSFFNFEPITFWGGTSLNPTALYFPTRVPPHAASSLLG